MRCYQPVHAEEEPHSYEASNLYRDDRKWNPLHQKNHLPCLPPEILLLILVELPLDCYLDLVQSSKNLRDFLKTNAALICNMCILRSFPLERALIPSAKINGWTVPTHTNITILESYVLDKKRYHDHARQVNEENDTYSQDLRLKLTQPGPLFLLWLQLGTVLTKIPKNNQEQVVINGLSTVTFLHWLNEELSGGEDDGEKRSRGFTQRELLWYYGVPKS